MVYSVCVGATLSAATSINYTHRFISRLTVLPGRPVPTSRQSSTTCFWWEACIHPQHAITSHDHVLP